MIETTLHEVVRQASIDNVDIIDLPTEQGLMALLRTQEMPEYAFVLYAQVPTMDGDEIMRFRMRDGSPSRGFAIVCACCHAQFLRMIENKCHEYGIAGVIMRDAWAADECSIVVAETFEHEHAMGELYGRKTIREVLKFIYPSKS